MQGTGLDREVKEKDPQTPGPCKSVTTSPAPGSALGSRGAYPSYLDLHDPSRRSSTSAIHTLDSRHLQTTAQKQYLDNGIPTSSREPFQGVCAFSEGSDSGAPRSCGAFRIATIPRLHPAPAGAAPPPVLGIAVASAQQSRDQPSEAVFHRRRRQAAQDLGL